MMDKWRDIFLALKQKYTNPWNPIVTGLLVKVYFARFRVVTNTLWTNAKDAVNLPVIKIEVPSLQFYVNSWKGMRMYSTSQNSFANWSTNCSDGLGCNFSFWNLRRPVRVVSLVHQRAIPSRCSKPLAVSITNTPVIDSKMLLSWNWIPQSLPIHRTDISLSRIPT